MTVQFTDWQTSGPTNRRSAHNYYIDAMTADNNNTDNDAFDDHDNTMMTTADHDKEDNSIKMTDNVNNHEL